MDDHLEFLHQQLRQELEAAYAAPRWDEARIALITSDMLTLERQLARRQQPAPDDDAALASFRAHCPGTAAVFYPAR